ncbi:MAG: 50S ribosomal protein L17 [Candidatus Marinimicrobia bacterium]|nr:50S ribosomal protein L17 [Candidatus Neomarinimicrobiota bacterium]
MRHQKSGRKLNRTASHRKALMMNMASSLVLHKRIRTTDAKAKELRGYVERLVTYAKKESVHGRRLIQKKLPGSLGKKIANILIHDIAPEFKERNGGYTRIIKLGNRKNDNASVSLIEFVGFENLIDTEVIEGEVVESEDA